jgi:Ca-activated chloride channel family protein
MPLQNQTISVGFENPYALVLIPASVFILTFLYIKSRKRSYNLASRLGRIGNARISGILAAAKFATAILIVFAAAQPYTITYSRTTVTPENVLEVNATSRIVVLLDISTSMGYTDTFPSRIGNAVSLVERIIEIAASKKDKVDVYGFSDSVKPLCINSSACKLDIKLERFSAIGDAIFFGYAKARASALPTATILITDGASNYGSPVEDAVKATEKAMVVMLVGNDQRALKLENACKEHRIPLFRVTLSSGEEDALNYVAQKLYASAKFEALKAYGQLQISVQRRDYSIQLYLLAVLILLFVISLGEGL